MLLGDAEASRGRDLETAFEWLGVRVPLFEEVRASVGVRVDDGFADLLDVSVGVLEPVPVPVVVGDLLREGAPVGDMLPVAVPLGSGDGVGVLVIDLVALCDALPLSDALSDEEVDALAVILDVAVDDAVLELETASTNPSGGSEVVQ